MARPMTWPFADIYCSKVPVSKSRAAFTEVLDTWLMAFRFGSLQPRNCSVTTWMVILRKDSWFLDFFCNNHHYLPPFPLPTTSEHSSNIMVHLFCTRLWAKHTKSVTLSLFSKSLQSRRGRGEKFLFWH